MDTHERAETKLCSVCATVKPLSGFYATRPKTLTCIECEKALAKERYNRNKEDKLRRCAEYRSANKAKIQAYMVRKYQETREVWLARCKEYRTNPANQESLRAAMLKRAAKRHSRILCATPKWVDMAAIKTVYKAAKETSVATGIPHCVDHVVPIGGRNVCGLHVVWNLQIVTTDENQRKGYKHS
jgi:hypothetical protein